MAMADERKSLGAMMTEAFRSAEAIQAPRLVDEYSLAKRMLPENIPEGPEMVEIVKKESMKQKHIGGKRFYFKNISYIIQQLTTTLGLEQSDELYTGTPPFQMMWNRGVEELTVVQTNTGFRKDGASVRKLRPFDAEKCLFNSRLYGHRHNVVRPNIMEEGLSLRVIQPPNQPLGHRSYTRDGLFNWEIESLNNGHQPQINPEGALLDDGSNGSNNDVSDEKKNSNSPGSSNSSKGSSASSSPPSSTEEFYANYEANPFDEDFLVEYLVEAVDWSIVQSDIREEEDLCVYEFVSAGLAKFARDGGIFLSEDHDFVFQGEKIPFRILIKRLGETSRSKGVIVQFTEKLVNPTFLDLVKIRVDCLSHPLTLEPAPYLGKTNDFQFLIPDEAITIDSFDFIVTMNARPKQEELTFHCKDGRVVRYPKEMVVDRCKTLLVHGNYVKTGQINCTEFSAESVSLWLRYLIHGTSNVPTPKVNVAAEVCYFSDQYNTPEILEEVAHKFIEKNLTRVDLFDALKLAYDLCMTDLAEKVTTFFIDNHDGMTTLSVEDWLKGLEKEREDNKFAEFLFTQFHNVFVRYLKGEYIPNPMAKKAKEMAAKWSEQKFVSEMERTLEFFGIQKGPPPPARSHSSVVFNFIDLNAVIRNNYAS